MTGRRLSFSRCIRTPYCTVASSSDFIIGGVMFFVTFALISSCS